MKNQEVYKLLKCSIFFLFFLFISFVSFSQEYKISGSVLDSEGGYLSYANVTVYDTTETNLITYAITNETGHYTLQLSGGIYLFKVSFLGYKPNSLTKNITKNEIIDFKLPEDTKNLDEIVVKSKSLDASIRNDTTRYNLENLTTGNEDNLKDILNKLPGVEIGEDGKIKAHGKKIDKLLVDGKDFFGEQHQLATENIGSEMVKAISLIGNYQDFSTLKSEKNSGKTAMNIEINENYKGRIKGNMTIGGGYKNKYELGANLFTFRKKTNLFFIASANNIGNQVFTFKDYISFQGGIKKFVSAGGATTLSSEELPRYLLPNNNVKGKNEQFSALNFSYNPSKKIKLNSYVIFDRNNITEEQFIKQSYFNRNVNLNIKNSKDNIFLVNNTFINAVYKPSDQMIFEYTFNFSPQKNNLFSDDNLRQKMYNTARNKRNLALNQALNFKNKFNKFLLSATVYQMLKNTTENLNIKSNDVFLNLSFPDSRHQAVQNVKNEAGNYGFVSFLSTKILKKSFLKLNYKISRNIEKFGSKVEYNPQLNNNVKLNVLENMFGLNFYSHENSFLYYDIGCDFSLINANEYTGSYFLPFAHLKFNFGKSHNLKISYDRKLNLPKADKILSNNYITDYKTFRGNQNITAKTIEKHDNFGFNYFIYDLFSETLFNLGVNYSIRKNITANNTEYIGNYAVNKFILGSFDAKTTAYLLFDKKISELPFNIRLKSVFSHSKNNDYVFEIPNHHTYRVFDNNIRVLSNLKKSIINFNIGYQIKQSLISNKNHKIQSRVLLNRPYLDIYLNYGRLSFTINTAAELYKTQTLAKQLYIFGANLYYKTENNKWKFYIKGKDLLNLNHNFVIKNLVYDNFFEESTTSTMGGYVVAGLTYKF